MPAINDWFQRSENIWNQAHTHLLHAIRRQKLQADRHRRPNPEYTPGQWVYLSTRDLRLKLPCRNLSPRDVGPFKIIKQITPVSFRLALPANYRIPPTFHVSLLKPAGGPSAEVEKQTSDQGPPPILGSVTNETPTVLPPRHQRELSTEYSDFISLSRTWS